MSNFPILSNSRAGLLSLGQTFEAGIKDDRPSNRQTDKQTGEWLIITLMFPSDEPLTKQSSVGSTARALTGESWAWKLWRWSLCGSSRMLIQPFLPPVMSSWFLGAMASTVAPESWQQKAEWRAERRRWRIHKEE